MRYRQLGSSGLTVSVVGIGCNTFGLSCDEAESRALVDAAVESGITFFDTAPNYGAEHGDSERFLGEAVKGRRDDVVIATKVGGFSDRVPHNAAASRRNVPRSVEASLRRLGTDFVDVLYLHQPDDRTPIEETLAVMDELVVAGKVRYAACANLAAWQVVEAEFLAPSRRSRFVALQVAYSLVDRHVELETVPVCLKYGIGVTPYFPLAHGLLAGTYRRGDAPKPGSRLARRPEVVRDGEALDNVERLEAFARDRDLSVLQVAVGGLAAKPAVSSVLTGASRPEQVHANAAAADWVPTDEDMAVLDEIARPRKYVPFGSRTGYLR